MANADHESYFYKIPINEILDNRKEFYRLQRDSGESVEKWLDRVRICIICCDFPKGVEYLLIDRFVCELNNNEREIFCSVDTWSVQKLDAFFKDKNDGIEHILVDNVKKEPNDDFEHSDVFNPGNDNVNVIEEEVPSPANTSHTQIGVLSTAIVSEGEVDVNLIDGMKCEFENYKYLVNGQVYESIDEMDHSVGSEPTINESTLKNIPENSTVTFDGVECNAVHSNLNALDQHVRTVHQRSRRYPCKESGTDYSCTALLKRHSVVHTGESLYKCDLCEKSFTQMCNLTEHKKEIHRPYSCEVCGKSFSALCRLKAHSVVHTGERPYKCDLCEKSFAQKNSVREHKKMMHQGIRPYSCEMCGKGFSALCRLKEHSVVHTGAKPYKCSLCERSFTLKGNLTEHKKVFHQGIRPYSCEVCGKDFSALCRLKEHSAVHTGAKPYKCNLCEKSFTLKGNLTEHEKVIHQGIRPYSCEVCGRNFSLLSNLKRHSLVHTGDRILKCNLCEKSFTQVSSLTEHKKVIHQGFDKA